MKEYVDWLYSFEYLVLPSWPKMLFYILLAFLVFGVEMWIYLRFFIFSVIQERERKKLYDDTTPLSFWWKTIVTSTLFCVAFVEEIMYHAPILFFVLRRQSGSAILALIFSTLAFVFFHWFDVVRRTKSTLLHLGIGTVFYGILIMVTASIWPSVFAHWTWNGFFLILIWAGKTHKVLIPYALVLQRKI